MSGNLTADGVERLVGCMRWRRTIGFTLFLTLLGVVHLVRSSAVSSSSNILSSVRLCQRYPVTTAGRHSCWRNFVARLVERQSVAEALAVIGKAKAFDSAFAASCHEFTHAVGEAAYLRFLHGKLTIGEGDLTTCSQGFYHGFLQELVSHSSDLASAAVLCDARRYGISDPEKVAAWKKPCFHGIGHGFSYYWGAGGRFDEQTVADRSVALCLSAASTDGSMAKECIDGVYGGIANAYFKIHGLSYTMKDTDPFWFCKNQPLLFRKYCYNALVAPLYRKLGDDFNKTAQAIAAISDREGRLLAMERLGWMPSYSGFLGNDQYGRLMGQCGEYPGELAQACLAGVAKSVVMTGTLSQGVERVRRVCRTPRLGQAKQEACLAAAREQIGAIYGRDKAAAFTVQ